MASGSLPPDDERDRWIQRNASELQRALANPAVRAELLALLGGDVDQQRRQRRLAELAQELDGMEVTWKLWRDDGHSDH
jgi:hypothetical protein